MPQKLMVAFDLVGTLVRAEAFHEARGHLQLDPDRLDIGSQAWNEAECAVDFKHRFDYRDVFRQILEPSVHLLYEQFRDYLVSQVGIYLYDEVCQALGKLTERSIRLGFVTDGPDEVEGEMIRRMLHVSGIPVNECIIVTGEQVGFPKEEGVPFSQLIRLAESYDIPKEGIAFAGDKPAADIDGPNKIGIRKTVLLVRNGRPAPALGKYAPWRTVRDLWGVVNLLSELAANYAEEA